MAIISAETDAYFPILDRPEARAHVAEHFADLIVALEDLTSYGTHLISRSLASSQRNTKDLVVLVVLTKQVVGLLDAAAVLHKEGCVQPSLLQLRAAFEASVYVDWILKRDSDRRATAYYVWNVRRALKWAKRARKGTDEFKALKRELGQLKVQSTLSARASQRTLDTEITRLQEYLWSEHRALNAAFDRRRGRRPYDPEWYQVLFPVRRKGSLYVLTRQVGRLAEYRLIYELGSEAMHSSLSDAHIRVLEGNKVGVRALRELTQIGIVAQLLMGVGMHVFIRIIKHYRDGEQAAFARTYTDRWRKAYLTRRTITYDFVEHALG